MERPEYITFDNIIVKVDSIIDVERPNGPNGEKTHVVLTLSSGRNIDTECPNEEIADVRYNLFKSLFNPEDWDAKTPTVE